MLYYYADKTDRSKQNNKFNLAEDEFGKRIPRHYIESLRTTKMFHFKVLKLTQYQGDLDLLVDAPEAQKSNLYRQVIPGPGEDNVSLLQKKKESAGSILEVKYHFFHRLLSTYNIRDRDGEGRLKKDQKKTYNWNCSGTDVLQRLYLDATADQMLEVIQNRIAILWNHDKSQTQNKFISWQFKRRILRFPFLATDVCSLPYFISGDFKFICDYNYQKRRLRVREMETGQKVDSLPREALMVAKNINDQRAVKQAFSCMRFRDNQHVETYNQATGILSLWPISKRSEKEKEEAKKKNPKETISDW